MKSNSKLGAWYAKFMENKNLSFGNTYKYFLVGSIFIILLGIIIMATVGMNGNFNLSGGYVMDVRFNTELTASQFNEMESVVNRELRNSRARRFDVMQFEGLGAGQLHNNGLTIKLNRISGRASVEQTITYLEGLNTRLEAAIMSAESNIDGLNIINLEISEPTQMLPSLRSSQVWLSILAGVILLVIFALYLYLRFDAPTMIASVLGALHDGLLVLALLAITRVVVSPYVLAIPIIAMLFSFIVSIVNFSKIREDYINEKNNKLTNAQVVSNNLKRFMPGYDLFVIAALIIAVAFTGTGNLSMIELGLSAIITLIVVSYSAFVITPSIWAANFNREKDRRLARRLELKNKPQGKEDETLVV